MSSDVRPSSDAHPSSSERPRVVFLGPLGTYSHQAATDFFGTDCDLEPVERIADVFTTLESTSSASPSISSYGIVPIENSSFGPVIETEQQLRTTRLSVRGMIKLKIGHALLLSRDGVTVIGTEEGKKKVERVYSHEQGIGQCRSYLSTNYPQASIVAVTSTAKAAQEAQRDPQGLAICSIKCAEVYDLVVVDTDIQDAGFSNTTRFIALSTPETPLPERYPISRRPETNDSKQ